MIGLQIVPLAGTAATPWRNAGGVTRELLAWPEPAGWRWRISVADVERPGPFSAYPGVERWFAVIRGAGVVLDFGDRTATVRAGDAALRFDGAAAPHCSLPDGPTRDLNMMLRGARGGLQAAEPGRAWRCPAALRALYCSGPGRLLIGGRHAADLAAAALVWHAQAAGPCWQVEGDAPAWWLWCSP